MRAKASGFTLVEVVVALFFIAIGVIATAPLFVIASKENAVAGDLGLVGAEAVKRMELLRGAELTSLSNGGSLTSNVTGFWDGSDPDVVVRWTISDNPKPPAQTKIVTVRASAARAAIGASKGATLVMLKGG